MSICVSQSRASEGMRRSAMRCAFPARGIVIHGSRAGRMSASGVGAAVSKSGKGAGEASRLSMHAISAGLSSQSVGRLLG